MICPNCKKQIPDDSDQCQHCGTNIDHKEQVSKETSLRRYQRWFFYAIIILVFIGMLGMIIRIYNANSEISNNLASIQKQYQQTEENLEETESELKETEQNLQKTESTLEEKTQKEKELQRKTQNLQSELSQYDKVENEYENCQLNLDKANSNIYKLIVELGQGVSNADLARIPLADSNLAGKDSDEDGLSDPVEQALGTDPEKEDTDGDGYTDKEEALKGFNPAGEGNLPIDENFATQMQGKILLQVDSNNEAWYVAGDGKRYFLGTPGNAYKTMRSVEYWTENPPQEEGTNTEARL